MTKRQILVVLAVFTVVLGGTLAHLSLRLGVIRLGYVISEKAAERRELEEEQRRLRLELSLLKSPDRIERLAREKLGMVRPDPAAIRTVRPPLATVAAAGAPSATDAVR